MDATSASSLNSDEILHIVAAWPIEEQAPLTEAIVLHAATQQSPDEQQPSQPHRRSTWDVLYGAAANMSAPSSDEQVTQWLDERRLEKYGSR